MTVQFKSLVDFTNSNSEKEVVVIQGIGFVGAVMSLVCCNAINKDYAVIGIDLPTEKSLQRIQSFNEGVFPLTADDPQIDVFFENSKKKKNFYATTDINDYIS